MELTALYQRVIGLDVHQAKITACAIVEHNDGEIEIIERERQEVSAILWHYKAKCRPGKPKIKELLAVLGKFGVEADKYGLSPMSLT